MDWARMTFGDNGERVIVDYVAATKPCIVVFRSRAATRHVLASAAEYAYRAVRADPLASSGGFCFCGEESPVPASNIERVERLD